MRVSASGTLVLALSLLVATSGQSDAGPSTTALPSEPVFQVVQSVQARDRLVRVYRYYYLPEYYDLSAPYDRWRGWGRRGYRDGSGRRGYRDHYYVPRLYERLERRRLNW